VTALRRRRAGLVAAGLLAAGLGVYGLGVYGLPVHGPGVSGLGVSGLGAPGAGASASPAQHLGAGEPVATAGCSRCDARHAHLGKNRLKRQETTR
jgi:hypothetical protein